MKRLRFSRRSTFSRSLFLFVALLFASLVTSYMVVLNFVVMPSLQQFNKVLAYEVRTLMTEKMVLQAINHMLIHSYYNSDICFCKEKKASNEKNSFDTLAFVF